MDEQRCYATTEHDGERVFCTLPAHPVHEVHRAGTAWWWLDEKGFDALTQQNGDGDVDMDSLSGERLVERVPRDPIVDSVGRRGVPGQEGAALGDVVQDAVRRLTAAIRAESKRELEANRGEYWGAKAVIAQSDEIKRLKAENQRLQKIILDAGTVITAAVGAIGEPREWSVKEKYRETFLGPKRARQWERLRPYNDHKLTAERTASYLGITHEAASSLLRDAEREGKAERVSRGVYRVAR
jgi:hypothetical protein